MLVFPDSSLEGEISNGSLAWPGYGYVSSSNPPKREKVMHLVRVIFQLHIVSLLRIFLGILMTCTSDDKKSSCVCDSHLHMASHSLTFLC